MLDGLVAAAGAFLGACTGAWLVGAWMAGRRASAGQADPPVEVQPFEGNVSPKPSKRVANADENAERKSLEWLMKKTHMTERQLREEGLI